MIRAVILGIMLIAFLVWFVLYAIKYKVFPYVFALIRGNKGLAGRYRRMQIKTKGERKNKGEIYEKLSDTLRRAGFSFFIPGEDPIWETGITVYVSVMTVIALGFLPGITFIPRLLTGIALIIMVPAIGQILIRKRTYEAESELPAFAKMAEGAVSQYKNFSDMIFNHYLEFNGDFCLAMEEYYLEVSGGVPVEKAVKHFEDKFCSPVINVAIENYVFINEDDRDMSKTSRRLAEISEIYVEKTSKNRDLLSLARKRLTGSLIFIFICFIAGGIYSGGINELLTYGNDLWVYMDIANMNFCGLYLLIISVLLYIVGIFQNKGF